MKSPLTIFAGLLLAASIQAAIINVPVDQPTIQAAIDAAATGDTVLVADGLYMENINFKGKAITVASHYLVDGDTSHISATVIDGSQPSNPDSGSVVTFESGEDSSSVLSGFTIQGGSGTITEYTWLGQINPVRAGGGIHLYLAGARISHNHIRNNLIPQYEQAFGGAVCVSQLHSITPYVILDNNRITDNSITGTAAYGSGISLPNGRIVNNVISGNVTTGATFAYGAVVCGADGDLSQHVLIQDNHITHNSVAAADVNGAGLSVEWKISAAIIGNEISDNEVLSAPSVSRGGGMTVNYIVNSTIIIDRNTITGNVMHNSNSHGGGISLWSGNTPRNRDVRITDNIISGNEATYGGGIRSLSSVPVLINNTIVDNIARSGGGGLYQGGAASTVRVINTILWGNSAPSGSQIRAISGGVAVRHSDVQGGWTGEGNINVDPLFADSLYRFSDNSFCIGAGIDSVEIGGVWYVTPDHDYGGGVRPNPPGSMPDIGAWEMPGSGALRVPAQYATIQGAINAAADNDVVLVADGHYMENINFRGKAITVASRYLVDGDSAHIDSTIIDGSQPSDPDSGSVVTFDSGEDTTSVLKGFTITGGSGTITTYTWQGQTFPARAGGGILCYHSGARIAGNIIMSNDIPAFSKTFGGGVGAFEDASELYVIIEDNRIINNVVNGGDAAASAVLLSCNGTIARNDISHNRSHSTTDTWGPISCVSENSKPRAVMITDNQITYNVSNGVRAHGGGLDIELGMRAVIVGNDISYNQLNSSSANTSNGGGIVLILKTRADIIDGNTISHNSVNPVNSNTYGGGIALHFNDNSINTLITNNIISGNSASGGGGVISRASVATFINNTIVDNAASIFGGGLRIDGAGTASVLNTILWGNSPQQISAGGVTNVEYSNVEGGWPGATNIDADPLFADTVRYYLANGSPCIDAGDPDPAYYDPEDLANPGFALWPALGTLRNDIGAYGGPGAGPVGGIEELPLAAENIPGEFQLSQNYPNPFNPITNVEFEIGKAEIVTLTIYDVLGRRVARLVDERLSAGAYRVQWDGRNDAGQRVASGVYYYRLDAGAFVETRKMILMR